MINLTNVCIFFNFGKITLVVMHRKSFNCMLTFLNYWILYTLWVPKLSQIFLSYTDFNINNGKAQNLSSIARFCTLCSEKETRPWIWEVPIRTNGLLNWDWGSRYLFINHIFMFSRIGWWRSCTHKGKQLKTLLSV